MTFWIMFAVSISGVVGRYLYAQIPRRVTTVELSMKELQVLQKSLLQQLATQRLLPEADLRALLRMSDAQQVAWLPIPIALIYMIVLDVVRDFGVARLRRHASGERFRTFFGFVPTRHRELEIVIRAGAEEAALSKVPALPLAFAKALPRLARDSSYAFAVLALMHISLQFLFCYF